MNSSWKTTLAGAIAGLSLAGFTGLGLPDPWPKVLGLVSASALAALGWHSVDCNKCPGNAARLAAGGATLLLLVCAAGCAVAGLTTRLGVPAFGSLEVSVGGGSMGNRYAGTILPTSTNTTAAAAEAGTNCTGTNCLYTPR